MHARYSNRDGNFSLGQKAKRIDHDDEPYTMNGMYFIDYRLYQLALSIAQDDLIVSLTVDVYIVFLISAFSQQAAAHSELWSTIGSSLVSSHMSAATTCSSLEALQTY